MAESEDYVFGKGKALLVHGKRNMVAEKRVEPSRPSVPRVVVMKYPSVFLPIFLWQFLMPRGILRVIASPCSGNEEVIVLGCT